MRPSVQIRGAAANAPALRIDVGDGRQATKPGDLLTYTVKIHNIGMTGAPGLEVVQMLPAGLKLVSATRHGSAHAGYVTWKVNLPAGRADTFGVVARVGQTPKQLLRLATIACASTRGSVKPIVCAAHSDELPAGAVAAADARHAAAAAAAGHRLGYLKPIGVVLLLGVAVAIGFRRLVLRRRARRSA